MILLGLALPVTAMANANPQDPLTLFATCAGRLSAEMEFSWLTGEGDADLNEQRRDSFVQLIEAVIAPGQGPQVMAIRVEAKMAHATLLTRQFYSFDAREARVAARMAASQTGQCNAVLIG